MQVTALEGIQVVAVSCCGRDSSKFQTMVLTATSEVYSWGNGQSGCLGHGSEQHEPTARKVEALRGVVGIAAGADHSAAWSTEGAVWTWGNGHLGELGHGNLDNQLVPRVVEALAGRKVVGVATGESHTAAWTEAGELLTWGSNYWGQLGHGDKEMVDVAGVPCLFLPHVVRALEGQTVLQADASFLHTVVITDQFRVFQWGDNDPGNASEPLSISELDFDGAFDLYHRA